jgi:gamma-glutamyltranspeptidase / glutathione hydrolase
MDQSVPRERDVLVQKDLATTYRNIAEKGIGWFYNGPFADALDKWMRENGGVMTAPDLAQYRTKARKPVVSQYRGFEIVGFAPPSSGGVHVAQILNILERFDVRLLEAQDPAGRVHVIAEAMKLGFADRAQWLGDPDYARVPAGLVSQEYADQQARRIRMDRATSVQHGQPPEQKDFVEKHTTHIAAADEAGNWVAITTTLNTGFGSKVMVPGTGVLLNNQMDDFAIAAGTPNAFGLVGGERNSVAPRKRPLSSMSPTIVMKDGQVVMTVGAAGGPTIITQVLLTISNVVDLGDAPQAALARPRFHQQWAPDRLVIENTFPGALLDELKNRGHVLDVKPPSGATQAIFRDADGSFVGVAEPRNTDAKAAGW